MSPEGKFRIGKKTQIFAGATIIASVALGGAYTQKDEYTDDLANFSRSVIGVNSTEDLKEVYFSVTDNTNRLKVKLLGSNENPFGDEPQKLIETQIKENPVASAGLDSATIPIDEPVIVEEKQPQPMVLPEIKSLRDNPIAGEGEWSTVGLPRTSPEDVLMAKTFLKPDASRDATVVLLLLDKRRIRLNMVGGTKSPNGEQNGNVRIPGPGKIPNEDRGNLLVAWNGGWIGWHPPGFGMVANGLEYRSLKNGFASVAVTRDGEILMGEWGRTLFWRDDFVAVRQNTALLVEDCKITDSDFENNEKWGYIVYKSQDNVTRRSAIGLTASGDLLVAAGNNTKPEALARAMWAAGACTAMPLDMNTPQVNVSTYFQTPEGKIIGQNFGGYDNPRRFLGTEENDFMYVVHDETNFKP